MLLEVANIATIKKQSELIILIPIKKKSISIIIIVFQLIVAILLCWIFIVLSAFNIMLNIIFDIASYYIYPFL